MVECLVIAADADEFVAVLERSDELPLQPRACVSPDEALDAYADHAVLFGQPDMLADVIEKMPSVTWVQSTWAGVTPLLSCKRRDYILTGVKDVFGPQMAEYVLGYLLAHELKVLERDRAQRLKEWSTAPSGTLSGKRLGIMGTGSIGQDVAKMAGSFGIDVSGLNRSGTPAPGFSSVRQIGELHDFLAQVDYLVATLPQTRGTDNLLDEDALAQLPDHAFFINVGRGNVVDDAALTAALRWGALAGAVLDVFDEEPVARDSALWDTPGLQITAHIAAISHPELIVPIFIDNCRRFMDSRPLRYVVDFDAGY